MNKKFQCITHNFESDNWDDWNNHVSTNFHQYHGYIDINGIRLNVEGKILKIDWAKQGNKIVEEKLQ